ncbi:MAG: acyl carrier protein [Lachnospiraceae bacterium]|nr:acyl carrier protein [Lachnospiraceae bacterium]MBQ2577318.1 acyl carrier protein [Lachnospiraceae bacterium]MBQ5483950.1 acyl carrier protein [Lachnospiraceae bacterium]MCR4732614.1 acyl carrier protein [Lachnospiraceae bacterium]MEE3356094.1 acyl carrier protein [Candidatus Weimeria sp.]
MTFEELKSLIAENLSVDEDKITPASKLIDDLEADSLSIVELHMAIEDETGVSIPDEEVEKLVTVQDVMDAIARHQA